MELHTQTPRHKAARGQNKRERDSWDPGKELLGGQGSQQGSGENPTHRS